jgi:hypothetical protein
VGADALPLTAPRPEYETDGEKPWEGELMVYEVRTYTLRPARYGIERFAKRKPLREKHSKLGAFWHTEFGPLNQVIHAWPYENLQHRTAVRDAMAKDAELSAIPGGRDLIVAQEADIVIPAPFMQPLEARDFGTGNVYEMRIYRTAGRHSEGAGGVGQGGSHP